MKIYIILSPIAKKVPILIFSGDNEGVIIKWERMQSNHFMYRSVSTEELSPIHSLKHYNTVVDPDLDRLTRTLYVFPFCFVFSVKSYISWVTTNWRNRRKWGVRPGSYCWNSSSTSRPPSYTTTHSPQK